MSLLGVYVIISYYKNADKSQRYRHKITNQRFAISQIVNEIENLLNFQSDALHWNLYQIEKIGETGKKALNSYHEISKRLNVEMHSQNTAGKRIEQLQKGKETFMNLSRDLAYQAQRRESLTIQPKEFLSGEKAVLTIKNYLGGFYYFTTDEVKIENDRVLLIEGKHSKNSILPSLEDIKDGLVKMILFTNLKNIKIMNKEYSPVPILKLTSNMKFSIELLNSSRKNILKSLKKESEENRFKVLINDINLQNLSL